MRKYIIESSNEAKRLDLQNMIDVYDLENELSTLDMRGLTSILDAGCGHGNLIDKLKSNPLQRLHGIDLSEERVSLAQERFKNQTHIEIFKGSLEKTPFEDESYDSIICRYIYEHVSNPQLIIQELARLLRPGGKFFIINFDDIFFNFHTKNEEFNNQLKSLESKIPHDFKIGRKLPQLLRKEGFKKVDWKAETFFFQGERLKLERENSRMRLEQAREMLSPHFTSKNEYDNFSRTYLLEMEDDCNVLSMTKFIIQARKEDHLKLLEII